MNPNLVAKTSVSIHAPTIKVWNALVNPEAIKRYMFGTAVVTDWREGHPIRWNGEWQGKSYVDKGLVLQFRPPRLIRFSHFSPLSGLPDKPENYHTVTIELSDDRDQARVSLSQDNNATEEAREHSEANWEMMLAGLKRLLEQ